MNAFLLNQRRNNEIEKNSFLILIFLKFMYASLNENKLRHFIIYYFETFAEFKLSSRLVEQFGVLFCKTRIM